MRTIWQFARIRHTTRWHILHIAWRCALLSCAVNASDVTSRHPPAASKHYRFGWLFTGQQDGWSGYLPFMLSIIDHSGANG